LNIITANVININIITNNDNQVETTPPWTQTPVV
jgi:hypothetical protein